MITSFTQPISIKYDNKRFLSQLVSELYDSLQENSTKFAPQYEFNSFVTMATYLVQDFPIIIGISGLAFLFHIHKWCLVYIIQQAHKYVSSSLCPCLAFFELKNTNILKSSGWRLEKIELPWEQNVL